AETRRQMLEYQLAFGVDMLLLIDMESKDQTLLMGKPARDCTVRSARKPPSGEGANA
ncbi:MAG: hypothetical protein RL385_1678, partial [Pseudomonadota bacterium]